MKPKLILLNESSTHFTSAIKLLMFDFSGTLAYLRGFDIEEFFSFLKKFGLSFITKKERESFISLARHLWGFSNSWLDLSQKLLKNYIQKPTRSSIRVLAKFLKETIIFEVYDDVKEIINLPFPKVILSANAKFLIAGLGLEKFFTIFTPKETKFLKPDLRAFLAPLQKLKIKPEEAIIVGNEIERDLIPAKNLGMEAILIDRENKIKNAPVKKINSLTELKNLLV